MWLRGGGNHYSSHLGEEPPPLPVSQFQISSTVSLENFKGAQLLLLLSKGPKRKRREYRHRQQIWCEQIFNISLLLKLIQENTKLYTLSGYASKLSFIFNWTSSLPENVDHLYLFIIVASNNSGFKVTFSCGYGDISSCLKNDLNLTLTCVPSIHGTQTENRWWCQWSSNLFLPPDVPGHQS